MQPHVLFDFLPNDNRDELDDRVQRTYSMLKQMIATTTTPKETLDVYLKFISAKQPTPPTTTTQPVAPPSAGSQQPSADSGTNVANSATPNVPTNLSAKSATSVSAPLNSVNQAAVNNVLHSNLEDLTMALLVAILAEPELGQTRYYQNVISLSKDDLTLFNTYLNMIIIEKMPKMKEHSIKQILWLTNQLIKPNSNTAETILFSYIRQLAGGDLSPRNLRATEGLLDLLIENRTWLMNSTTFMVQLVIFTFMRLILDHLHPAHAVLLQREIDFVIGIISERFLDCLSIGRDFLRLLYQINKIPEFEKLWLDICNNPETLHPTFQGPMHILSIRTSRRLILSRLTFEMERRLCYLASQVKFGNQKKFQDLFSKQFLSSPESISLRGDLIRFICTNIHPSNEVLCSDVVPRWAIVGWLLGTCATVASAVITRLALFYDWMVHDTKPDNIMNIEPGILVMYYSMRAYISLSGGLLDFLCRLPVLFIPKLSDQLRAGIKKSLTMILEKRVISSLPTLFESVKFEESLRNLIKESYPEFVRPGAIVTQYTTGPVPTQNQSTTNTATTNSNTVTQQQPQHQVNNLQSVVTDNGISAHPQQFIQVLPGNLVLTATTAPITTNEVNQIPKPPNHLPLVIKQENLSSNDHILKTNSPTDFQAFGTLASGLGTPPPTTTTSTVLNRFNSGDNGSTAISPGVGDTVTPAQQNHMTKDEKTKVIAPNPWSGTMDRPTSPEVMIIDQIPITSWSHKDNLSNELANNSTTVAPTTPPSKQQVVNNKLGTINSSSPLVAPQQHQSLGSLSESQPKNINNININNNNNSNNNNNMTKTTSNQSTSKNAPNGDSDNIVNNIASQSQQSCTSYLSSSASSHREANNSKQQITTNKTIVNDVSNQESYEPSINDMDSDLHDLAERMVPPSEVSACVNSSSTRKVIYPFMKVPKLEFRETSDKIDSPFKAILYDLDEKRNDNEERCKLVEKLLDHLETQKIVLESELFDQLAHCLAFLLVDDFTTKIFPSSCSYNNQSELNESRKTLEKSLTIPFFKICERSFDKKDEMRQRLAMTLLVNIYKYFEAASFLVLYWLRANHLVQTLRTCAIHHGHIGLKFTEFCRLAKRGNPNKDLYDDLKMAATYDVELFCFIIPCLFGDLAMCGIFNVTGNIVIIRLVVSNLDPISLQELICLCLTGTAKVINKEDVIPLIQASLSWESWEQYNLWKLISAQAVPVENYVSILPKLNLKDHPEAMSSILLNLQRINEPTTAILQTLLNCECNVNNHFVSSILRYWSMKTDVQDLARLITSLVDARPASPPVKRKGGVKSKTASTSSSLTPQTEKILNHLESIRLRAPKNKLLAQNEVIDLLSQLEGLCNEQQKQHFDSLFQNRPKPAKKQKRSE